MSTDEQVSFSTRRSAIHPINRSPAPEFSGRISVPVVLLNNRVDPTVLLRFACVYPELVAAAGRSAHLRVLPPTGETHCDVNPEQISAAFAELVSWAESGDMPQSR